MPNQAVSQYLKLEKAREPLFLVERSIVTSGDLHRLNLEEERGIISPLQMIEHPSPTSTYFVTKTKPSPPTKNTKSGLLPSYLLRSKFYIQIEVTNTKQGNSSLTSNLKAPSQNTQSMILQSILEWMSAKIKQSLSKYGHDSMLVDSRGPYGERRCVMSFG